MACTFFCVTILADLFKQCNIDFTSRYETYTYVSHLYINTHSQFLFLFLFKCMFGNTMGEGKLKFGGKHNLLFILRCLRFCYKNNSVIYN